MDRLWVRTNGVHCKREFQPWRVVQHTSFIALSACTRLAALPCTSPYKLQSCMASTSRVCLTMPSTSALCTSLLSCTTHGLHLQPPLLPQSGSGAESGVVRQRGLMRLC